MDSLSPLVTTISAAFISGILFYATASIRSSKKLPPGPKRLPLIGNAHQMPTEDPWLVFAEWGKKYGDFVHVDVFGKPMIIVNSPEVAKELLEKRSAIYSGRPHFVFAGDLVHYDESFVLLPYGERWKKQRRLMSQHFSQSALPRYDSLKEKEIAILIRNVIESPSDFVSQLQLRIGIIIIRITYGYYIQSANDPFLTTPLMAMTNFSIATKPGNFLVDIVPSLKHIPRWMPGSSFLKTADEMYKTLWSGIWNNFQWCKTNLDTGKTLMPNLCGKWLQDAEGKMSAEDEKELVWTSFSVMGGGLDTSLSSAQSFWMAMILNPRIQAKAQAELDSVVGKDRLPSMSDKPNLPYIRSIVAEVFRWSPAIPLSLPHASTEDDLYDGYAIAKGTLIMPNVWSMLHDAETYPNPMEFYPERYDGQDSEMKKVTDLAFGFGRRVCPGLHFAEGTLFLVVATTLATCNVLPGLDENGKEVLPSYAYTTGTIAFPKPFKMRLEPRTTQAKRLLSEVPSNIE